MLKWINLENGLKSCSTIDSLAQSQFEQERQRWGDILERLLAIVNFLASHNLAFRGHREKLTSDSDSRETSANFIYLVKLQERQRWGDILERLLAIVNFLASHNLAFRGHREKLTSDSDSRETSANFIYLVKLIARFDPVLRLYLKQVKDKTINDHCIGKNIQNELIQLMASHVKTQIVEKTINNKYYSIILDCTRDVSPEIEEHFIGFLAVEKTTAESLTNYIITELDYSGLYSRCFSCRATFNYDIRFFNTNTAEIEEYFIGFLAVEKATAQSLTNYIITELEQLGISLQKCRGQGYDNGANMRGEKSAVQKRILDINPLAYFAVQKRILDINPLAYFLPCGNPSWNLILFLILIHLLIFYLVGVLAGISS
ncbi:protein of unknown function (DUF4371) [Popillia japonica]|uniref:DUF4371 domain-containing protein n=1 Tax=Popillia japonica TaxID=7064 RepID=A0AAW1N3A2_POPJA